MDLSRGTHRSLAAAAAALALLLSCAGLRAQGTIYRCHALSGALLFQDRPCNAVPGTREARANSAGEVVATAPPPVQSGTSAAEHYSRYLDFVSKDRREQQAADEAETARLRAEAAADRAEAAATAPAGRTAVPGCQLFGPDGECVASVYAPLVYPYYLPPSHRPVYHGPYRTPAPKPPPKRDARSEILSLAP
ncbi:MAG: hypothetical protein NVS9B10_25690 [Nevskia sp.]